MQGKSATFAVALLCVACFLSLPCLATQSKQLSADELITRSDQAVDKQDSDLGPLLKQLHEIEPQLTPVQREHLAYLDAVQSQHAGNDTEAGKAYRRILEQTDDTTTVVRTRVRLIALDLSTRNYLEAYALANTLLSELPEISSSQLQALALRAIIRVRVVQKQYDSALTYTKQLETLSSSDQDQCVAKTLHTQILLYRYRRPDETRAEYEDAVRTCQSAGMLAYVNTLRLDWASQLSFAGKNTQAMALLRRSEPDILRVGNHLNTASLHVTLAQAYLAQSKYKQALASAQTALSINDVAKYNWTLQAAYKVLYQANEALGNTAAALSMYKKYVEQYKATADDAQAQALAYQMVKQDVLAKKMKLEELSKQNKILQLRQSLDRKSAETSRLYILLLLFVLASIALWAYRTKHSQLRFRHMARQDDLTGAFNRQHFMEQAEHVLQRLHKTDGEACLMILDMDHFKRVNDLYGHVSGDTVLRHVAGICRGELRASDVFGRLGGEEFGVLMPNCTPQQGKDIGDRIRHALMGAPVKVRDDEKLTITTSIGLTSTHRSGYQLKRLLIHADEALYEAKRNGRNQLMIRAG